MGIADVSVYTYLPLSPFFLLEPVIVNDRIIEQLIECSLCKPATGG